jgi:hypothetical protein
LDERHVATLPYTRHSDESQTLVFMTRGHEQSPYTPADLRTMEEICARFATHFADMPAGVLAPRALKTTEHEIILDAQLHPADFPRHAQAILSLFYGRLSTDSAGQPQLPAELTARLRQHRQTAVATPTADDEEFRFAFTRPYRGRLLCLTAASAPAGGWRLTCHEDLSCYDRLRFVKKACWDELARDRRAVYHAALALLDGERDPAVVARRAGIAALKPSSAVRIINQARKIAAAASG